MERGFVKEENICGDGNILGHLQHLLDIHLRGKYFLHEMYHIFNIVEFQQLICQIKLLVVALSTRPWGGQDVPFAKNMTERATLKTYSFSSRKSTSQIRNDVDKGYP